MAMRLVDSVDYFLREVLRLPVQKALDPNDPQDFIKIVANLTAATKGLTQADEAKALKKALDLLDVDWKGMKGDAKAKVVAAAKQALNPSKIVLPKIKQHFEANAVALGVQTKGSTVKQFGFGIDVDLTKVEQEQLWHVALSQGNYVRDEYGKRSDAFSLKAKEIIAKGLEQGMGRKDLAQELRQQLSAQQFNRSEAYWTVVAGAFANRARTFTNLSTYETAGVETFEVDAVLDERTSDICRFMHGKRFSVSTAKRNFTGSDVGTGSVQEEQPWMSIGRDKEGGQFIYYKTPAGERKVVAGIAQSGMGKVDDVGSFKDALSDHGLERRGIMSPPFHGNCRTTVNPVLETGGVVTSAPGVMHEGIPEAPPPAFQLEVQEPPKAGLGSYEDIQDKPAPPKPPREQQGFKWPTGPGIPNAAQIVDLTPLQPTAPPVKAYISPATKKKQALEELTALMDAGDADKGVVFAPGWEFVTPKMNKELGEKAALIAEAIDNAVWKDALKGISNLKVTTNEVDPVKVKAYLNDPKLLKKAEIKVIEMTGEKVGSYWKKNLVVAGNSEAVLAHQLLGKDKVNIKVISLKEFEKEQKAKAKAEALKPKAPPPPPPPPPPMAPPPVVGKPESLENLLFNKTGGPKGSNDGGFYTGKDGKQRYVKFYQDEAQAHGEVLANSLYRSLGFNSPSAVTLKDPSGKNVYAVDIMQGSTLGSAGKLTKDNAKEFMRGFAADVLMGNWDAAGMSIDNAFVLDGGKGVIRIDNGGSFLMRAKAGRKPDAVLGTITEWDLLFDPVKNPGYAKVAKMAGYDGPEDFKAEVKRQIDDIVKLRERVGGWKNYVEQYAPALNQKDKDAIINMLEKRTELLKGKAADLDKVKPNLAGHVWRDKEFTGVPPKKGLKIDKLPEAAPPPPARREYSAPSDKMPWDESRKDYQKRAAKEMAKLSSDEQSAIVSFTGSGYGSIRRQEEAGSPDARSNAIKKAMSKAAPEAVTTYRGIQDVPMAVVEKWLANDGVFRLGKDNVGASSSTAWHPGISIHRFMGGEEDPRTGVKVLFQIHGKSGIAVETISAVGAGEAEILFGREAEFRIKTVARWQGKKKVLLIQLEEI